MLIPLFQLETKLNAVWNFLCITKEHVLPLPLHSEIVLDYVTLGIFQPYDMRLIYLKL